MLKECVVISVVLMRAFGIEGGYFYPHPPPPQFDEPATPSVPIYLPPPAHDEIHPIPTNSPPAYLPPDEILPPLDDTIIVPAPPNNQYLPPSNTKLQVLNMTCLDSRDGYFRATFRHNGESPIYPVMETSNCLINKFGLDGFRIDLEGQKMMECGVKSCGGKMCLVLRMALVPGVRVIEDGIVTLQCIPQETVVSHTKHFRFNTRNEQGRSSTKPISVASGGAQRQFESAMSLFRKNNGVFDQPVQQGSAVRFGDELLLRATIREQDGWQSGHMGSVLIRSASTQRTLALVDDNGCRNPSMRFICPQQPQQVTPLTIHFPFRAFLFQGAPPADDLLLSVKMSACLRSRDCFQSKICEEHSKSRITRAANNVSDDVMTDWEGQFQFRVLPPEVPVQPNGSTGWLVLVLGAVALVLGCGLVCLMARKN